MLEVQAGYSVLWSRIKLKPCMCTGYNLPFRFVLRHLQKNKREEEERIINKKPSALSPKPTSIEINILVINSF